MCLIFNVERHILFEISIVNSLWVEGRNKQTCIDPNSRVHIKMTTLKIGLKFESRETANEYELKGSKIILENNHKHRDPRLSIL